MAKSVVTLKVAGLEALKKKLGPTALKRHAVYAMDVIVADASGKLAEASPVGVFGTMQGAWLQTTGTMITGYDVIGFSDPTPSAPYAWFVIHGRAPGKMPPPTALLPWVWKKLGIQGFSARAVAWNIARKIGRKGTKPNPFTKQIIRQNRSLWRDLLIRIIARRFHG